MKRFIKSLKSLFFFGLFSIFIYGCSGDPQFPEIIVPDRVEAIRLPNVQRAPTPDENFESPRLAILGLINDDTEHTVSTIGVEYERVIVNGVLELNPIPSIISHQVILREDRDRLFELENDLRLAEFDLDEADAELITAQAQGDQEEIDRLTALIATLGQEIGRIQSDITDAEDAINNAPFTTDSVTVRNGDLLVLRAEAGAARETLTEAYLSITNRPEEIAALQTELMDALINPDQNLTEEERNLEVELIVNEMQGISMTTEWAFSTPVYDRAPSNFLDFRYVAPDDGELVEGFGGTLRPRNFSDGVRYQERFEATAIATGFGETNLGFDNDFNRLFDFSPVQMTDEGLPITVPVLFNSGVDLIEEIQFFDAGQIVTGNDEPTDNTPLPDRTIIIVNGMIDPNATTTIVEGTIDPATGLIPLQGASIHFVPGEGMTIIATANRVFSNGNVSDPDFTVFSGVPSLGDDFSNETGTRAADWRAPADRTERGMFPIEVRDDLSENDG